MERKLNQPDELLLPPEQRSSQWYLQTFNNRWKNCAPFPDIFIATQYSLDDMIKHTIKAGVNTLTPTKLTAVVIKQFNSRFEVLIGNINNSGYQQLDHELILKNYGIDAQSDGILSGFLIESKKRCTLTFSDFNENNQKSIEELEKCLKRYKIYETFVHQRNPKGWTTIDPHSGIKIGDFTELFDRLIFDDWTRGFAEHFGWTYNHWLRFRLIGHKIGTLPNNEEK